MTSENYDEEDGDESPSFVLLTVIRNIARILWSGSPNDAFLLIVGLFAVGLFGFLAFGIIFNITLAIQGALS